MFNDNCIKNYPSIILHNNISLLDIFERGLDYIATVQSGSKILVEEILGIIDSPCRPFRQLNSTTNLSLGVYHNYLIVACYIKDIFLTDLSHNFKISYYDVVSWLVNLDSNYASILNMLSQHVIDAVQVIGGKVIFDDNFPKLNLNKLIKYKDEFSQISHTTKVKKLNIEVYYNHNGRCLGATNYWLRCLAHAYSLSNPDRHEYKNKYVMDMEICRTYLQKKEIIYLLDKYTHDSILALQSGFYISDEFHHVRDLCSASYRLVNDIITIMQLFATNDNLEHLYIQMVTVDHAMGMILIRKGVFIKVLMYDANDPESYMHVTLDLKRDNRSILQDLIDRNCYFDEALKNNIQFGLILKCYTYKEDFSQLQFSYIDSQINIDPGQILLLGLRTNNKDVIKNGLNNGGYLSNTLHLAVMTDDIEVVNLVLSYLPDTVNDLDGMSFTPLCRAVLKNNLGMVNTLLCAGARVDIPDARSAIKLANKFPAILDVLLQAESDNSIKC